MDRRFAPSSLLFSIISVVLLTARFAVAAPNDAAVQKLRDQAIDQDYLATNYAAAEKKLTDALALCKRTTDCSPFIRARVHCDLGVVEFMLKKVDLARTEFATALLEDPNVELDKDLANTDVQKEFAAAKGGGPPPPEAPAPAVPTPAEGPAPAPAPEQAASGATSTAGVTHTPPVQQQVRTPVPLYVEVAADLGATRVVVKYKPSGGTEWKSLQLDKVGKGFGGQIPCLDVGPREGELDYYVQVLDQSGDLVATSGKSGTPHAVAIVKKLDGEAPHLPGKPPPASCKAGPAAASRTADTDTTSTDASDCPPGFPGCHPEGGEPTSCESRDDCMAGEECIDRVCKKGGEESEEEARVTKKNWLSVSVQADLMVMPGAENACSGGTGYTCFLTGGGSYYADVPSQNVDDQVLGGFATSPMLRVMLGYDRVFGKNLLLGGRIGYAFFGGGPQRPASNGNDAGAAFMPLHLEARLAYYFGKNPFAHKGFRFYLFAAAGMAEVDASQNIDVFSAGRQQIFVDAWRKTGLGFGAAGPAVMWAVSPNSGFLVELKPEVFFPTFGFAVGATLGYTIGL